MAKEMKCSTARFEQLYSFKIQKILLWDNKDDELLKKCLKIGKHKSDPCMQEDLILELEREGYPQEIEIGPFGAGVTWVATTTCSTEMFTDSEVMLEATTQVNRKFYHDVMQTLMDETQEQIPEESISVQNGTIKFKFSNQFITRGSSLAGDPASLGLFPELENQLSLNRKATKKTKLFKILKDSSDEFGEELEIDENLEEAAFAIERVYRKGYVYGIGQVTIDAKAKPKNLLLLGKTGVGKSLLGNVLLDKEKFKVSNNTRSCTKIFSEVEENEDRKIRIMDGRGFLDTSHIKKMIRSNPIEKEKMIAGELICTLNP